MNIRKTPKCSSWRPFEEARDLARGLGIKTSADWKIWARTEARPDDIPAKPDRVYADKGWKSWADWLATKNIKGGFRPFAEARVFARGLQLKKQADWFAWAMTDSRPDDIPVYPDSAYKHAGWSSWSDWLGTKRRRGGFRSFNEARLFAKNLKFNNQDEWKQWAHSEARPSDVPVSPETAYKGKGWISWGDWLGTGRVWQGDRHYRPYDEAQSFARDLGLTGQSDWRAWTKKYRLPDDIPANPDHVYKGQGWICWKDWLGAGRRKGGWRPYLEACSFAQSLGLVSSSDWQEWCRQGERPDDIPSNPNDTYRGKGWISWEDWLGRDNTVEFFSFEKAREIARSLKLRNRAQWNTRVKTDAKPNNIPSLPNRAYKEKGWAGWADWLGTKNFKGGYRTFEDARSFVRSLKFQSLDEWYLWSKSEQRPRDISKNPWSVYKKTGWTGFGDWLGITKRWNKNAIIGFLRSIESVLPNLQPNELFAIMRQNGMITAAKNPSNTNAQLIKSIKDLCSSSNPESDFAEIVAEIEKQNELLEIEERKEEETTPQVIPSEKEVKEDLPRLRSLAALKAVDALVEAGITSDEETIEFLVANRVSGLWQAVLNNDPAFELNALRNETGGTYFNTIRSRFLTQYDGAQALALPAGYDFRVEGKLAEPNLMQRLAAYRVLTERRLGNWSGVGAGKTLSAILASRVVDAHLTVVVAFNSTVVPWEQRIIETFPDSIVHIKERGAVRVDPARHTYLVLNFETFQQPDSAAMVRRLVEQHRIDFVVLDEIQSVKQRTPKVASKRRQVVSGLLSAASDKNPNLCVLGMSATPVINNLYEAKALLELVKGVEFNDLKTFSSIANASAMHEKLILHGIRYRPRYSQTIETEYKDIPGNEYLLRLQKVRKGAILDLERVLLDAKIETILAALKKGTLVYTHYLTGLVTPLRRAIEKAGFKVGLFTGEDKSGLEPFKQGKVDVLIGSVPVGTGVDGLQYVCNRMIVVSLPWTSAEYEQLIGRLYRQGSVFDKVEVIIPQVVLEHKGNVWSWDKMRMHRIQYKKTLADAALDGVIPEGELASPETMFKQAREALQAWIARVEQDGLTTIDRAKLRVPLPEEEARIVQRRFGDLSMMNSRFNAAYSQTTHERLKQNPEEWYLYHTLYREARQTWSEIPFERVAKSLGKRPDWIVGDFGCGEAKLAEVLPNKVHSFDHVAVNETVTACDMSHTPLDNETLDVAVFALSLMGLNYSDYLKEAYRTLKFGGLVKIAEPANRWAEKKPELLSQLNAVGFCLLGEIEETSQFFYITAVKPLG